MKNMSKEDYERAMAEIHEDMPKARILDADLEIMFVEESDRMLENMDEFDIDSRLTHAKSLVTAAETLKLEGNTSYNRYIDKATESYFDIMDSMDRQINNPMSRNEPINFDKMHQQADLLYWAYQEPFEFTDPGEPARVPFDQMAGYAQSRGHLWAQKDMDVLLERLDSELKSDERTSDLDFGKRIVKTKEALDVFHQSQLEPYQGYVDLYLSDKWAREKEQFETIAGADSKGLDVKNGISYGVNLNKKAPKEVQTEKVVEKEPAKKQRDNWLPKEDYVRQKQQEQRYRDLKTRGLLNSIENGVSGDPDYDFDEPDM